MSGQSERHLFVVFGGTGDLMRRKLLPALAMLKNRELRDTDFHVLGVARDVGKDDDQYRDWAASALRDASIELEDESWLKNLYYHSITRENKSDFDALREKIEEIEDQVDLGGNRIIYLALPPPAMEPTIEGLGRAGLNRSSGWTRLVIEKPFGRDLDSANHLNEALHRFFQEPQVYRIDHYLGKETVQNLLVFRFANPVFESVWNRDHVQSVRLTVAESLGVGTRAGYYEKSGALRDMVQNHLTQLLCLTAMEAPVAFDADSIRDEKVKILRSVLPIEPDEVVFGQYGAGKVQGEDVPGYLEEEGVAPDSQTETFVSLNLGIASWRWQGVPFLLRTGKRLKERVSRIAVRFRCPPVSLFHPFTECQVSSNELIITIQPDEGFDLRFEVKTPGQEINTKTERLRFRYSEAFVPLRDAYVTLLLDVAMGDQTLFVRADEAEHSWRLYDPLLEAPRTVHRYEAGTWGPKEAGFFE
ncbi:MAG: glucose-6-phosphate dehydrogenase [Acidobacteriota bacterium]